MNCLCFSSVFTQNFLASGAGMKRQFLVGYQNMFQPFNPLLLIPAQESVQTGSEGKIQNSFKKFFPTTGRKRGKKIMFLKNRIV